MTKVIGYDEKVFKKFTSYECGAIVEYAPNEAQYNGQTDEGTKIKGLNRPGCGEFHRTNP